MQLTLSWLAGGETRSYRVFDTKPVTIGRGSACQIILADESISQRHAQIFCRHNTFYLRNLSRTRLIQVNSKHSEQQLACGESTPLQPGDCFRVETVELSLQMTVDERPALAQRYQVRCAGCRRKVGVAWQDCPWCGASLAFGLTF